MKATLDRPKPVSNPAEALEAKKALRKALTQDEEVKEFLRKTAFKEPLPFEMQEAIAWLESKYEVSCPPVEITKFLRLPRDSLADSPLITCNGSCTMGRGARDPKIFIRKSAPPKTLFHEYHHWLELCRSRSTLQSETEIDKRAVDDFREFQFQKGVRDFESCMREALAKRAAFGQGN